MLRCFGCMVPLDGFRVTTADVVTDRRVAACGGATSKAPVVVGGSEASPAVHNAIAPPKRECSYFALLCKIRVSLSLSRALEGCGALCVSVVGF
jgi:hypothetical protein